MLALLASSLPALSAVPPMLSAVTPALSAVPPAETFPDLGLTITFPGSWTDVAPIATSNPQLKGRWSAKVDGSSLEVDLFVLANEEFDFHEPDDVTDILLENVRDAKSGDPGFWFTKNVLVQGPFGYATYGSVASGPLHGSSGTEVEGTLLALGGLLEKHGYSLEITCKPAATDAQAKLLFDFLSSGVVYKGATRNAAWTDEERKRAGSATPPRRRTRSSRSRSARSTTSSSRTPRAGRSSARRWRRASTPCRRRSRSRTSRDNV
jgi:hypothetical protein